MSEKTVEAKWKLSGDDQLSGAAKSAADALGELRDAMQADTRELAAMQKAMRQLKASSGPQVEAAMVALKEKIKLKTDELGKARAAYVQLGGGFGEVSSKARSFTQTLGAMPGPFGTLISRLSTFAKGLDASKLRVAALAAAFLGLSAAAAKAAQSLLSAAIASGDARRNELLHFDALTKMRNLYGLAAGKASDMQAAVDAVSGSVSISRGKVAELASSLYRGGLRGKDLSMALEGASIKASALGESAGSGFAGFAASVHLAGGSVKRMTDDIKNRFGGVVEAKMKSLEVQTLKQKENFDSLFDGLHIEPFLDALKSLRDMLSQSTASGQALRQLFTIMLEPLLGASTSGLVMMRRFFKQMLIGVQELVIAFLTVRNWFRKTFGAEETDAPLKKLFGTFQWGRLAVYTLAAGLAWLAVSAAIAAAPFLLIGAGVYFALTFIQRFADLLSEIDWSKSGSEIISGIWEGLKRDMGRLLDFVSELGGNIIDAFKSKLGIASPSKVFAEFGLAIPQGVTQGIDKGAPQAQRSADALVSTPRLGNQVQAQASTQAAVSPRSNGSASAPVTLHIAELNVTAQTEQPKAFAEALRRELEAALSSLTAQLGTAEV